MKGFDIPQWINGLEVDDIEELKQMSESYKSANLGILVKPYMKHVKAYQSLKDTLQLTNPPLIVRIHFS